jgi:hypothetical protein
METIEPIVFYLPGSLERNRPLLYRVPERSCGTPQGRLSMPLMLHQGYFDGALVGWGEFANPNTMAAQFVGVPAVNPTYGTVSAHGGVTPLAKD